MLRYKRRFLLHLSHELCAAAFGCSRSTMAGVAVQFIVLCYLLSAAAASLPQKKTVATVQEDRERERRQRVRYTASWAVEITEGGEKMADLVARRHGYRNLGKVSALQRWSPSLHET